MITEETKNAVLKALGHGHVSKIAAYANDQGVTKDSGEPYSNSMISMVLRGKRENEELEDLILACVDHHLLQKEEKQKRIKSLVEKVEATPLR